MLLSRIAARPLAPGERQRRASDDAHAAWHLPEASAARGMRVETLFVLVTLPTRTRPPTQIVAYALEQNSPPAFVDAGPSPRMTKIEGMGSLL